MVQIHCHGNTNKDPNPMRKISMSIEMQARFYLGKPMKGFIYCFNIHKQWNKWLTVATWWSGS